MAITRISTMPAPKKVVKVTPMAVSIRIREPAATPFAEATASVPAITAPRISAGKARPSACQITVMAKKASNVPGSAEWEITSLIRDCLRR